MALVALLFWVVTALAILAVPADVLRRRGAGFAALALVSWLALFSFLAGFSIGLVLAMGNMLFALVCTIWYRPQRAEFAFVTVVSMLLALFMRGHWPPARPLLVALLLAAAVLQLRRFWARRAERSEAQAQLGLQMVGLLLMLSLLLSGSQFGLIFGLLAAGASLYSWFGQPFYRQHAIIASLVTLAWMYMLVVQ